MGGLFLYKNDCNLDIDPVLKVFTDKGFSDPILFKTNSYTILNYPKIKNPAQNYLKNGDNFIICAGTIVYKKHGYSDSLKILYEDIINNAVAADELLGTFFIIVYLNEKLSYLSDRSGIQNIFYSIDKKIISTSFLACSYSFQSLTINNNALRELLTSGTLIGPDTIFNEVFRYEVNINNLEGLSHIKLEKKSFPEPCKSSFESCVNGQIDVLENYFNSIKSLADGVGVDSGLTGGHDSRLIMILGLKYFSNISFHSHWREGKSIELDAANEVSRVAGVKLTSIPVMSPRNMSTEQIENNFTESFLYFDGLSRMHSFWTEEYNTREYREKVLNGNLLGLSGIGGEQYRNEERMNRRVWNLKKIIKYKVLLYQCGDCYSNEESLNNIVNYISNKIIRILGLNEKDSITHLDFKRYLNEVFIPGRLGVRNNAENQLSYFLSPFTDYTVANESYAIVNKLGISDSFEETMIRLLNPKLAAVDSDHGYDFHKGEPLLRKIKSYFIDLIPIELMYRYYSKQMRKKNVNKQYRMFIEKSAYLREGVSLLNSLDLKIDLDSLSKRPDLMPLILANGFLLNKFKDKIKLN
jgi:hypothetical protein